MAKVLLINGSPHEHGCTAAALAEMVSVEKVRVLLRTSTGHTVKDDAAKILNDAFAENFKDLQASVK